MFNVLANSMQVILMLSSVLLFHINIETNTCLHALSPDNFFCQVFSTSVAHNSPIDTLRSSRQPPLGVDITVVSMLF